MEKRTNAGVFPRKLCDEDWKWGDWIRAIPVGNEGRAHLWCMAVYEYAREYARKSSVLHRWAVVESIERETPDERSGDGHSGALMDEYDVACGPDLCCRMEEKLGQKAFQFLWALRKELAGDVPWLRIDADRREKARKAVSDYSDNAIPSAPTFFTFWPCNLQPAHEDDCAMTWESWAEGKKRSGCEVIAFKVDWANSTNAELAESLAVWRPSSVPEPRRKDGKGKAKSPDYEAALRSLAVLRLWGQRQQSPLLSVTKLSDSIRREFGSGPLDSKDRERTHRRDKARARKELAELFGWIDAQAGRLDGEHK